MYTLIIIQGLALHAPRRRAPLEARPRTTIVYMYIYIYTCVHLYIYIYIHIMCVY